MQFIWYGIRYNDNELFFKLFHKYGVFVCVMCVCVCVCVCVCDSSRMQGLPVRLTCTVPEFAQHA